MLDQASAASRRTTPAFASSPNSMQGVAAAGRAGPVDPMSFLSPGPRAAAQVPALAVRQADHAATGERAAGTAVAADNRGSRAGPPAVTDHKHSRPAAAATRAIDLSDPLYTHPTRRPYVTTVSSSGEVIAQRVVLLGLDEMRSLGPTTLWNQDGLKPSSLAVAHIAAGVAAVIMNGGKTHLTLWHSEADPDALVEPIRTARQALERRSGQICQTFLFTNDRALHYLLQTNQLAAEVDGGELHFARNYSAPEAVARFVHGAVQRRKAALQECVKKLECELSRVAIRDLPTGIVMVKQGEGICAFEDPRYRPVFVLERPR